MFDAREFHTSKDMEFPNDYEDAFCFDGHRGLATVADGVSSAIFSRQWADLLTRSVIHMPPDLYTEGEFQEWLAARRAEWIDQIDLHNLPWNQRQKLQMVGGAFSTLLWLELYPWQYDEGEEPSDDEPRRFRMRSFSVGDCSLFQVRNGEIIRAFPLETAAEFDEDPISICSVNLNRDHQLAFQAIDDDCLEGDLLVMCSDAIGKWAMTRMEEEDPPDWESYWDKPYDEWIDEIVSLRQAKLMRYDDTTLLLLRVGAEPTELEVEADLPIEVDEPGAEADEQIDEAESLDADEFEEVDETESEETGVRVEADSRDDVDETPQGESELPCDEDGTAMENAGSESDVDDGDVDDSETESPVMHFDSAEEIETAVCDHPAEESIEHAETDDNVDPAPNNEADSSASSESDASADYRLP